MKEQNKMKNIINKFVVAGALLLASLVATTSQAVVLTGSVNANSTNTLVLSNTPALIYQIQFVNVTNVPITVAVWDAPTTNGSNSSYVITPYTNSVITTVNYTNIYTNILGTITTNIYTNIMNTNPTNAVAQYTNNYNQLWFGILPTNSTTTFTPPINLFAYQGIVITNSLFTNGNGYTYLITELPTR